MVVATALLSACGGGGAASSKPHSPADDAKRATSALLTVADVTGKWEHAPDPAESETAADTVGICLGERGVVPTAHDEGENLTSGDKLLYSFDQSFADKHEATAAFRALRSTDVAGCVGVRASAAFILGPSKADVHVTLASGTDPRLGDESVGYQVLYKKKDGSTAAPTLGFIAVRQGRWVGYVIHHGVDGTELAKVTKSFIARLHG